MQGVNLLKPKEVLKLYRKLGSKAATARYLGRNERSFRRWFKRNIDPLLTPEEQGEANCETLLSYLRKPRSTESLACILGETKERILTWIAELQEQGYNVVQRGGWMLDRMPIRSNTITALEEKDSVLLGIVSDTHFGSTKQQLTHLHDFYDYAYQKGVRKFIHAGDITAGVNVYRGQHNELFLHNEQDQAEYTIRNYPRLPDVTTYLVSGNHDLVCIKRGGVDPVKLIAAKRDDIKYLGRFGAWLNINEIWFYILHPEGGGPAKFSATKLYNTIDRFNLRQNPDVLILGHWHQQVQINHRGVYGIMPGCFEGTTSFSERRGMVPHVGGCILEVTKGEAGNSYVIEQILFDEELYDYPQLEVR